MGGVIGVTPAVKPPVDRAHVEGTTAAVPETEAPGRYLVTVPTGICPVSESAEHLQSV